jgi:short-subunit dehydrogenase
MPLNNPYKDKIALITGASSGIGAKTALFLASRSITVLLVARREEKLQEISQQIISTGGKARYFALDLTLEGARMDLFRILEQENLLPDILINNAGMGWYGFFHNMSWTVANDLISLNVTATAHFTSLFLPNMLIHNYGHIINIGSIAGKLPEQGVALYASSKAFIDSFTTALYRELRGTKVKVSVLRAGPIKTEFFDTARNLENGGNIPAEKHAVSVDRVIHGIWQLLQHPKKVRYIPGWFVISPLLEFFFESIIDFIGPLLLGRKQSKPSS